MFFSRPLFEKKSVLETKESALIPAEFKILANERVDRGYQLGDKSVFFKWQDGGSSKVVIYSKGEVKTIDLPISCELARPLNDTHILCGNFESVVVVDVQNKKHSYVIKNLNFKNSCIVKSKDGKIWFICSERIGQEEYTYLFDEARARLNLVSSRWSEGRLCGLPTPGITDDFASTRCNLLHIFTRRENKWMLRNTIEKKVGWFPTEPRLEVLARPGGYILIDVNNREIEVTDEQGVTVADWSPTGEQKKILGKNFRLGQFHLLADGDSFLATFDVSDFPNRKNLAFFKILSLAEYDPKRKTYSPKGKLTMDIFELPLGIRDVLVDNINCEVLVVSDDFGDVFTLPQLKKILEKAAMKKEEVLDLLYNFPRFPKPIIGRTICEYMDLSPERFTP